MKLTKRYIELETKSDAESIRELQRINDKFEELDARGLFISRRILSKNAQ